MMEFWPENQGQSHLYYKFGTVPGRHYTHNYHDRHQTVHSPLYYGEQQPDQGRESTYWTVPGSRTGGALHEYTNWTDADLAIAAGSTSSSSSQFPFILDRYTPHHQDLGEYHPQESRDWPTPHRASRENERQFLREGWQRRWEPCNPVRYNREISAKRSEHSYRELEAWAARYSHSLPRRRRLEAELRGASQGQVEGSRSGTDHQVTTLQHAGQSANIRESGLWDRGGRKQAFYTSPTPAPDTSHVTDMKDNTGYQRRLFSQPPGYIAPPPYNSPHKSSPVKAQYNYSWEQEGKSGAFWPQSTVRKQDVTAHKGKTVKEEFTKPEQSKTNTRLEGLMHQRQEADTLQTGSAVSFQSTNTERQRMLFLQQPRANQNSEPIKETSKVIEGRKFRLNKKAGGMTIFCLVSRIADSTETPSLPLCTSQTHAEVPKGLTDGDEVIKTHKLPDEVDFKAPSLTEQSNSSDVRNLRCKIKETSICTDQLRLEDSLPSTAEINAVSPEKTSTNDDSTFGKQVDQSVQAVTVKYPLWKEPSFTSRADNSSTCSQRKNFEEESDSIQTQHNCSNVETHPIDIELRRLDIKQDTVDSKGLLVIDTTCVVVKMELIKSPKKEHVHFLGPSSQTRESSCDDEPLAPLESNHQVTSDVTTGENSGATTSQMNQSPETKLGSILSEEEGKELFFPCMSSSPDHDTLEQRAERILGIPQNDCILEHQSKDEMSNNSYFQEQNELNEPTPIKNDNYDINLQVPVDETAETQAKIHSQLIQTKDAEKLTESNDARNEDVEDFAGTQEQMSDISEENETDSQLELYSKSAIPEMAACCLLETCGENSKPDQTEEENEPVEDVQGPEPPDLLNSSSLSPLNLAPSSCASDSYAEGSDPQLDSHSTAYPETSCFPEATFQELSSPSSASTDSSHTSNPHSLSPPTPLDSAQTDKQVSDSEDQVEEDENEIPKDDHPIDIADEAICQQQLECGKLGNTVTDEQQINKADEEPMSTLEQSCETSEEKKKDGVVLQQRECVQIEDCICTKEINEEQPFSEDEDHSKSPETNEDNTENEVDSPIGVKNFQQEFQNSCTTEDQPQNYPEELNASLWDTTGHKKIATDPETQIQSVNLQNIEPKTEPSNSSPPSALDCELLQASFDEFAHHERYSSDSNESEDSNDSDPELVSFLDSVSPSILNPDTSAGIVAAVPISLCLDPSEESLKFLSSNVFDSLPVVPSSSTPPPPSEGSDSPDFPPSAAEKEKLQYPKSLWDVVNRIRKHTAPDSENEEEEMSELWDPENVSEELGCPGVVVDTEDVVFDEAEQQEVFLDHANVGHIQQDHKKSLRHAEEDTLSCSSTSSHSSGDTVIGAEEDEVDETTLDNITKSKIEEEIETLNTTEGELSSSGEIAVEKNKEQEKD